MDHQDAIVVCSSILSVQPNLWALRKDGVGSWSGAKQRVSYVAVWRLQNIAQVIKGFRFGVSKVVYPWLLRRIMFRGGI